MNLILQKLMDLNVGKVIENERLANHTTMKVGGPADIFVEPNSIDNVKQVLSIVKENNIPLTIIGRGSNLLVTDKGIRGVVLKIGDGLEGLTIQDNKITVGAGYSIIKLASVIGREGLSGLEFAGGIPGSVGGAVFMNAGAHGSDISKILNRAHILFLDGAMEWVTCEEMEYSYRTSILQNKRKGICLEAEFNLTKKDKDEIASVMQKHKDYRRDTQPWNYPCAGSIFRNPLPNHSGKLIEESGLKGFSIGGAQVSEKHANFIVNTGNAKAEDVLNLISHIKNVIFNNYQVELHTEVEVIGEK